MLSLLCRVYKIIFKSDCNIGSFTGRKENISLHHSCSGHSETEIPFYFAEMTELSSSGFCLSVCLSVVVKVLDTLVIPICVIKFTIIYNNNE